MLTRLEKAVIDELLRRRGEPFDTIRQQVAHASIAKREFTGVGFFTEFALPADAPVRRDLPDDSIGGVGADFPDLEGGVGFMLSIRGGVVTKLEGFTFDEPWPTSTDEFELHRYIIEARRQGPWEPPD